MLPIHQWQAATAERRPVPLHGGSAGGIPSDSRYSDPPFDAADPSTDLSTIQTFLEADSPQVQCAEHGLVAAQVPWARHDAGHVYAFDDTAAWLVRHCSKCAVRDLARIAWRTVGSIAARVVADAETKSDRFKGLTQIGMANSGGRCNDGCFGGQTVEAAWLLRVSGPGCRPDPRTARAPFGA
jgi:Helix-turn-helix domain of transposase family ISL3